MTEKQDTRNEKIRELQSQLSQQVETLVSGEDWARMLTTAAKFHHYSANNVMLIMVQRPDATRVAGFNTWKSLGRFVRKGEHGIKILAPCRYTYKYDDDEGNEHKATAIRGFTTATVFDISQTDGADLDEIRPTLLEGEAPAGLWDALAKQVASAGFMLARCDNAEDIHGANGVTNYLERTVTVRSDVSEAQAVKTLAHELGHILCGHESELRDGSCRGRFEVEAESVAYIVAAASGMSTDDYSLAYVAGWSSGDAAKVRQTAEKVVAVADAILCQVEEVAK